MYRRPLPPPMFAPGLISAVFYRRRPTTAQIALGVGFTVVGSGLLGYLQDAGTSRVWENVALAIGLGLVLYVAILAYLVFVHFPRQSQRTAPADPPRSVSKP